MLHDSTRIQESREINASLMVFKQCVKHASQTGADFNKIPYRESKITRILKDCFIQSSANPTTTLIITTISPSSQDTEHTLDSLNQTQLNSLALNGSPIIISTNIDKVAIIHGKGSKYDQECEGVAEVDCTETDSCNKNRLTDSNATSIHRSSNPREWSSKQVVEWFLETSIEVCAEIQSNVEESGHAMDPYLFFDVLLSSKKWVALRQEGKDSIGLSFDTDIVSTDDNADADAADEIASPFLKVTRVLSKGYITMHRQAIKQGWELYAINGTQHTSKLEYEHALKDALRKFKANLMLQRDYESNKVKFMTDDMKILRDYILNGPTTVYKKHKTVDIEPKNEESDGGGAVSIEPEKLEPSMQNKTKDNYEESEPSRSSPSPTPSPSATPSPPPPDYIIKLRFREKVTPALARPVLPPCPRIFTGESRLGTIWAGNELVDKFGRSPGGLAKFIQACGGDRRIAEKMYEELNRLIG
jgi:hypothetical protein